MNLKLRKVVEGRDDGEPYVNCKNGFRHKETLFHRQDEN